MSPSEVGIVAWVAVISFAAGYALCFWERRREIMHYHQAGKRAMASQKHLAKILKPMSKLNGIQPSIGQPLSSVSPPTNKKGEQNE